MPQNRKIRQVKPPKKKCRRASTIGQSDDAPSTSGSSCATVPAVSVAEHPGPLTVRRLSIICEDKMKLRRHLQEWGLIPKDETYACPECGSYMKLYADETRIDGWLWTCRAKVSKNKQKRMACNTTVSLRTGSFFARSHLKAWQILCFIRLWAQNVALKTIAEETEMDRKSAVDWASFCREVVQEHFLLNSEPLGGPGLVVEIDESKFGHRKYHRGHRVEGSWIFGGYERGSGRVFLVPVQDRTAATLMDLIKRWIRPGSTIISDFGKAYDGLDSNPDYEHLKVNHSLTFKDPVTGAHTNSIESTWRAAKEVLPPSFIKAHLEGNLARYMFYKKCAQLGKDRTIEFFKLAGQLYNPLEPQTQLSETDPDSNDLDNDVDDNPLFLGL